MNQTIFPSPNHMQQQYNDYDVLGSKESMDTEVQGIMIYSSYLWDLVQAHESASSASSSTPNTSIDSIRPNNHPKKKQNLLKKVLTHNKLYRIALAYAHRTQGEERQTWNPALKRGSEEERNQQNQSPSDTLLIVSKLASETVHQQNLMQISLGKPYQIVSNLKRDQPISGTSCSSAYQN